MEPYELLSDSLPIFIELLLNAYTTIIKLFIILVHIIITYIDLFIKILVEPVINMMQFISDVLQILVQELQDLLILAETSLLMM